MHVCGYSPPFLNQGCGRGGRVTPWENKEGEKEVREREENRSFCDRDVSCRGRRFNVRLQNRRKGRKGRRKREREVFLKKKKKAMGGLPWWSLKMSTMNQNVPGSSLAELCCIPHVSPLVFWF